MPSPEVTGSAGSPTAPGGAGRPLWARALVGFGRFWWDFLVGDTPELFVGMLLVVGIGAGLVAGGLRTAAVYATPVLVVLLLVTSVQRGRRAG